MGKAAVKTVDEFWGVFEGNVSENGCAIVVKNVEPVGKGRLMHLGVANGSISGFLLTSAGRVLKRGSRSRDLRGMVS